MGGIKSSTLRRAQKCPQRGWKTWLWGKEVKSGVSRSSSLNFLPGKQEGRAHARDALERYSVVSYEHASGRLRLDIELKPCKEERGVLLRTKRQTQA